MARTIAQIRDEIITAKGNQAALVDMDSDSLTSPWRLWAYVTAVVIWTHETFFDTFADELQDVVDLSITGTGSWYVRELLKFQLGDPLEILDGRRLGYSVEDETKQIISFASYDEQGGLLLLRAAKDDGSSNPQPLTPTELAQVTQYVEQIRFAGTATSVRSVVADLLEVEADIYYDALYDPTVVKTAIVASIEDYLGSIEFGGLLLRTRLVDSIQAVQGVRDVVITTLTATDYQGDIATIERAYKSVAGYMKLVGNSETNLTTYRFEV